MSNTIAEYFATLKFKPDVSSIRKVDQFFRVLEARMNRASRRMSPIMGSLGLGNPANKGEAIKAIREIGAAQTKAISRVISAQLRLNDLLRVERSIREANLRLMQQSSRFNRTNLNNPVNRNLRNPSGGSSFSSGGAVGAIAGASVAGFGIGQLSDVSQRLEMLPVSMEAVTGSAAKAAEQLEFLAKLGHEMGATRLELAPEYTKMLASAMGTKLEGQMPTIFSSMTRYGKVMGLDPEEMKGSFKAVSQMINKQQIMAEELKGQLAERLPAAVRIMADAVTGGDTKKLFAMMKAGQLDPNTALPKFAMEMEKRAAGGMEAYKATQRGQQNFARVALEDQVMNFGEGGGNAAFFKIYKTFADTLPKMNNLVKALAGAFQGLAKVIEGLGITLQFVSKGFDLFYSLPADVQTFGKIAGGVFAALAIQAGFLGKALARAFLPLTAAYLIIEDIAYASMGYDSITKRAMDYFDSDDSTFKKITNAVQFTNPAGMLGNLAGEALKNRFTGSSSGQSNQSSGNSMFEAIARPFQGEKPITISIDVTGETEGGERLAKRISEELSNTLKPLIFNKVPVE